ncbi:MAG TPA: DEAD/DEAH box helicase, partial [Spirochaetota bacterium]|nr:DEAD/DEAH box helicase [Spirochaetota bacterium]
MNHDKPLIVQSDNTLLLEVDNPLYEDARDAILPFAELEKSPEHIHSYRVTPLSLWNAASSGMNAAGIIAALKKFSRYDIPEIVLASVKDVMGRYGLIRLEKRGDELFLASTDALLFNEIVRDRKIQLYIDERVDDHTIRIKSAYRGHIKQALIRIGFPVEDLAGYDDGDPCLFDLREIRAGGAPFAVRDYQQSAINAFYRGGGPEGGSGVIVLPCGAGKTIVGIGIMALLKTETLIMVTNTVALRQWRDELTDKTGIDPALIGEYSGERKEIKPVTIATYNIITYRKKKHEDFLHFNIFMSKNWGLIIYDEVHLLPAPVFRITSEIQSKRRLGLTATLVREDGLETDVFSLIGPKKFDMPWKILEKTNWIATAICTEIRVELPDDLRMQYSLASDKEKFRVASENERKTAIVRRILAHHEGANVLIIGQYLEQLRILGKRLKAPVLTGQTPEKERERLFAAFRTGELRVLIVSKVANFAIDLP